MKDIKDILNSGISDELLAAYIDGNTTESENQLIESSLNGNSILAEAYEIANDSVSFGSNFDWELHKGDFGFWELGLPPVVTEEEVLAWEEESDYDDEIINNDMEEQLNASYQVVGEPGENASDPIFIQQPDDHSCALRSQQIVLRDFGIDIPFNDLEKIALENDVYTTEGTYTYDIGKVLELAGVGMHQVTGTSMEDLMNELSQGHRVIVSVDADELWYNDSLKGRLKNWFNDVTGHQGGNHALIVAGVEVNPNDVNDIKVVLTDPGAGHLRIEYPASQFMDAWKDSNCFMAATDNPAPYQYDASTGMEVPSNFSIQQHFNQFVAENSYQLSPDMINVPIGYQPAFAGSIDLIGLELHDSFHSEFNKQTDVLMDSSKCDDSVNDDSPFIKDEPTNNILSYGIEDEEDCDDNRDSEAFISESEDSMNDIVDLDDSLNI